MREKRKEEIEELVKTGQEAARKAARLAAGKPLESESESENDDDEWGTVEGAEKLAVNKEEQYVDEDKFTTVTVEEMDLNASSSESEAKADAEEGKKGGEVKDEGKEKKKWPKRPKEKKKKFR
jgi:ribosomal RNA-processing protein 17